MTTIDEAFETVRITLKAWEPLAQIEIQASPALAALDLIRKRIEELERACGDVERLIDAWVYIYKPGEGISDSLIERFAAELRVALSAPINPDVLDWEPGLAKGGEAPAS